MIKGSLVSWGFKKIKTEDYRIINYEGIKEPENKMTSYEMSPGIFIMYINLKKKYRVKDSNYKGNTGYSIGYCKEGNYFTHINDSKILITTNEIFVGKPIPKSKQSYTSSHNTIGFNIVIADKKIIEDDLAYPYIKLFQKGW